jgi:AraC family transcriptional activator FtrA
MPTAKSRPAAFNRLVVALAYEGLCAFEFSCTAEVFGLSRPEFGSGWYRFQTCGMSGPIIRGQYGLSIQVDRGLDRLAAAGTIIIPGWKGIDVPVPPPIVEALCKAHARGARLLSICSGSFVLAATGLLDGKRATTHWRYADEMQRRYPRIRVNADVLYVDEGQILTSAGSAAGLDLCLHLVRRDYGPAVANQVARRLVIPPHRDGGQAQYLKRPVESAERGSFSAVLDKIRRRLGERLSIAVLARLAAMSQRTFIRRFRAATGMTPADWLTRIRIERAREYLESTTLSIDVIAARSGLGTATTMRHHFRRKVGVSPVAYRRRFSQTAQVAAARAPEVSM